jgi:DME family drug/metabolite transporter
VRWNLSLAALAAAWGAISVLVAAVDLGAVALAWWRVALASVTVAAVCVLGGRAGLLRRGAAGWRVHVPGVVLAVHWLLFFETVKLASVAVAVLTVYTAPLFLAVLAPLVLPERRSAVVLVALAPAGAGLALIALGGDDGGRVSAAALATGLAAAATYAALVLVSKRLLVTEQPARVAFRSYLTAAVVLAPLLPLTGRVFPAGAGETAAVLTIGVVFTGLAGLAYFPLLRHVTGQAAGVLAFLEPVSAALLAWAVLGEPVGWQVAAGGALVVAAGVAVVLLEPADAAAVETVPVGAEPDAATPSSV